MTRALSILVLVAAVAGCATMQDSAVPGGSRTLRPLNLGWERYFSVTWEQAQRGDGVQVSGYVDNTSPYDLVNVRVLVDGLDPAGQIVAQRVAWVPGEMRGGSHSYFGVTIQPAAAYRVSVFSYDRLESATLMSLLR